MRALLMCLLLCGLAVAACGAELDTYPADAYSRPRHDHVPILDSAMGFSTGGLVDRAAHFSTNLTELAQRNGKYCTRWRLVSKDAGGAALSLQMSIKRPFEAVSFRVFNNSAREVEFGVQYGEQPWHPVREVKAVSWILGKAQKVGPGEEKVVRFLLADAFYPERSPGIKPAFPGGLNLTVGPLPPGETRDLYLSDLTIDYPAASDVSKASIECPHSLVAGKKASFAVSAQGKLDGRTVDVELWRESRVLWRTRLTPAEVSKLNAGKVELSREVPWYVAAGDYTLGLVVDGYRVAGSDAKVSISNDSKPKLAKVERRLYNGRPTVFVNGKPFPWQGYACYDWQPGNVGQFGASGANLFCVEADAGAHLDYGTADPEWPLPGVTDYGQIEERVGISLKANPNANILMRVSLGLPPSWVQAHEDQLVRVRSDAGEMFWEEQGQTRAGSFASEQWAKEQERGLRELIAYCKSRPWASRVVGFLLTCEVTEEWFTWGANDGWSADFSAPNQRGFAEWAKAHDIVLPAGDSPVPAAPDRYHHGFDVYPDDEKGRIAAFYQQYNSELTAHTISRFCRVVKQETGGQSLTGVFFGYVLQLSGEPRQSLAGHWALDKLIHDPDVDFFCGIPLHNFRRLDGYSSFVSATESILAAGKLYINENDLFSWIHPLHWNTPYNLNDPRAGAISMHRRECANEAVHGALGQWFSLMSSWHYDTGLQADFARQMKVYAKSQSLDRTPVEQIAFVVDDNSFTWTPPETTLPRSTNLDLLHALAKTGAPLGVWLLADMDRLPKRIKMVIVANAAAPSAESAAKLKKLVEEGGRTIVVIGPAGLVNTKTGRWQAPLLSDLPDMPGVVVDKTPQTGSAKLADGTSVSSIDKVCPRVRFDSDGFMRYADGPTAAIERPLANGGRLIWCGVPPLSTDLLGKWVEQAGVHAYAPAGFAVYASRELVSITSSTAGIAKLKWPDKVAVKDLFDGWTGSGSEFDCPFELGQTRLFEVSRP
jgi:hypothetical protein